MGFTITLGWFNSASILYLSILVANIYITRNSQNNDKFIPLKHFLFKHIYWAIIIFLGFRHPCFTPLHYIGLSWVLIYSIFLGISNFAQTLSAFDWQRVRALVNARHSYRPNLLYQYHCIDIEQLHFHLHYSFYIVDAAYCYQSLYFQSFNSWNSCHSLCTSDLFV